MSDEEGDSIGTLRLHFLIFLNRTVYKSADDAGDVLDQIVIVKQDVVLEGPVGRQFETGFVRQRESQQNIDRVGSVFLDECFLGAENGLFLDPLQSVR